LEVGSKAADEEGIEAGRGEVEAAVQEEVCSESFSAAVQKRVERRRTLLVDSLSSLPSR
jgi:hypothetical protein